MGELIHRAHQANDDDVQLLRNQVQANHAELLVEEISIDGMCGVY